MVKDKNEFNFKKTKRNRSTDFIKEVNPLFGHDFGDVSENEEEENSDSSNEEQKKNESKEPQKKTKTYSIGYLTKTIWNNKIYSDDFDADFDLLKKNQSLRFKLGSVQNSAIQEDNEQSEMENPYFSDNS